MPNMNGRFWLGSLPPKSKIRDFLIDTLQSPLPRMAVEEVAMEITRSAEPLYLLDGHPSLR